MYLGPSMALGVGVSLSSYPAQPFRLYNSSREFAGMLWHRLVAVALFASVFGCAIAAQTAPPPTPPISLNVSVSPVIQPPPVGDQSTDADWAMVKLTAVATITGLLLLFLGGWQFVRQSQQTRESLRLGRESNETSRLAREEARVAQTEALRQAQREMYLSLRARMGMTELWVRNFAASRDTLITFKFKNFGGKGAFIVETNTRVLINDNFPSEPEFREADWKPAGVCVEAGDLFEHHFSIGSLTPEQWSAITDELGAIRIRVVGAMRYRAGFSDDLKTLKYARQFNPLLARLADNHGFEAVGGPAYNNAE